MGRRKIRIARIHETRTRNVTFHKRKIGVMKKCYELATLCGADVAMLVMYDGKLSQYSSMDLDRFLPRFLQMRMTRPVDYRTNREFANMCAKANGEPEPDMEFDDERDPHYDVMGHHGMGPHGYDLMGGPSAPGMMGGPSSMIPPPLDPQGYGAPPPSNHMQLPPPPSQQGFGRLPPPQSGGFLPNQEPAPYAHNGMTAPPPHQGGQMMRPSPSSFSSQGALPPAPLNMQGLPPNPPPMDGHHSASISPFPGSAQTAAGPSIASLVGGPMGGSGGRAHGTPSTAGTPVIGAEQLPPPPMPQQQQQQRPPPLDSVVMTNVRRRSSGLRMATPPETPPTMPGKASQAPFPPPLRVDASGHTNTPQRTSPLGHSSEHAMQLPASTAASQMFGSTLLSPNTASLFQALS